SPSARPPAMSVHRMAPCSSDPSDRSPQMTGVALRSRYIPWLFVAGFALVVAVNATMIWLAVRSSSGLHPAKPRDRGLNYNAVVEAQKSRDALGWRIDTAWHPAANRLEVAAFD